MSKNIKVSVIIPVYNQAQFVAETLASVLAQETDFSYEVLVGDDLSTDGSREVLLEIAKKNEEKVRLFLNDHRLGPTLNPLNLLNHARGEYIAHFDGDDLMLPDKLQKQVNFLDENRTCSFCCHKMKMLRPNGDVFLWPSRRYKKYFGVNDLLLNAGPFFAHSSKMFRLSMLPALGFDTTAVTTADYLWHMQNLEYGKGGYLDEALGIYRVGVGILQAIKKDPSRIEDSIFNRLQAMRYALKIGGSRLAFLGGSFKLWLSAVRDFVRLGAYGRAILSFRYFL